MENVKVIIIGGGIAGLSAAEEIRKNSDSADITIISAENQLPYYRLSLTRLLAGEVKRENMIIHPEAWYMDKKINIKTNTIVNEICSDKNEIALANGENLKYDKLIIATGANPFVPPINGCSLNNVKTIRKLEDIDYLLKTLPQIKNCVCIGGGIIGIEVAGAIAKNGAKVTLVQNTERLMQMQLNQKASDLLEHFLNDLGIVVKANANVSSICGAETCEKVVLATEELCADMVIISAGIKQDTDMVKKSGLKVERGLVVDDCMQTSTQNIYAAGDVAEHNGRSYGLWSVAQMQGKVAALNAIGMEAKFEGVLNANTVKVLGIDIFSIGEFIPTDSSSYELEQETMDSYINFVFRDGKIVGCILLSKGGNKGLSVKVKQAVEKGVSFSTDECRNIESIVSKLID